MKLNARQNDILLRLQDQDLLEVEALAALFGVSTQTIRKDINQLSEQGLVRRLHGGVGPAPKHSNLSFITRQGLNISAKQTIAQALLNSIPEGASVFLGIGSTVAHAAKALLARHSLRVITNNLDVAAILCDNPRIDVLLTGGRLRHRDRDVVGEMTTRSLDGYRADFGVFGTGAINIDQGLMEFDPADAELTQAIARNAEHRVLIMDDSKWQRRALVKTLGFEQIDTLITNELPSADVRDALARYPLRLIETDLP